MKQIYAIRNCELHETLSSELLRLIKCLYQRQKKYIVLKFMEPILQTKQSQAQGIQWWKM